MVCFGDVFQGISGWSGEGDLQWGDFFKSRDYLLCVRIRISLVGWLVLLDVMRQNLMKEIAWPAICSDVKSSSTWVITQENVGCFRVGASWFLMRGATDTASKIFFISSTAFPTLGLAKVNSATPLPRYLRESEGQFPRIRCMIGGSLMGVLLATGMLQMVSVIF